MILPLITLLKLIALGSIKLIFLLLGIAFFPVFALRLILGGATSMLLPTLDWLVENERIDTERHRTIVDDLDALTSISFSKKESRVLLWKLITKMMKNMMASLRNSISWCRRFIQKLFG